eukprot:scaffold129662_cov72-Phaeocystis_antarctica.AAC.4
MALCATPKGLLQLSSPPPARRQHTATVSAPIARRPCRSTWPPRGGTYRLAGSCSPRSRTRAPRRPGPRCRGARAE